MVFHVDSDAAYLIALQAKSRITGLSTDSYKSKPPPLNGGVLVKGKILRHVVCPAAEAEVAGLFYNTQTTITVRWVLRIK